MNVMCSSSLMIFLGGMVSNYAFNIIAANAATSWYNIRCSASSSTNIVRRRRGALATLIFVGVSPREGIKVQSTDNILPHRYYRSHAANGCCGIPLVTNITAANPAGVFYDSFLLFMTIAIFLFNKSHIVR